MPVEGAVHVGFRLRQKSLAHEPAKKWRCFSGQEVGRKEKRGEWFDSPSPFSSIPSEMFPRLCRSIYHPKVFRSVAMETCGQLKFSFP
jgi:hypothetical protein